MAHTTISDIANNSAYLSKCIQLYASAKSALVRSGIVQSDPNIAALVAACGVRGTKVNLPFFNDLTGDDEELSESASLTPAAITGGQDVAAIHRRGKAFAAGDIAASVAGEDPLGNVVKLVGDYILRQRQRVLFASLKGLFADNTTNDSADLVLDISSETGTAANLTKDTLLYAAQLLGDAKENLVAIACHSQVELALNELSGNSQTYRPANEQEGILSSYNGKQIIMDDSCGFDSDTSTAEIYLFGKGAFAMEPAQGAEPAIESYRDALSSVTGLIERDFYILHPRGFAFTGTPAGATPTIAELGTGANWNRVYDKKSVRVCKLKCKIA